MASVTIRNLPDEVKATLREEARKSGRSLESHLRLILTRYATAAPEARITPTENPHPEDWLSRD
jgi:plasmid stability protein